MEALKCIMERKITRHFEEKNIPHESIKKVIKAGIRAPSPLNSQPWHFHIIEGEARNKLALVLSKCTKYLEDILKIYSELLRESEDKEKILDKARKDISQFFVELGRAPVLIVVTMPEEENEEARKAALIANGCAIQNIQLASWSENIGCVCLTCCLWVDERIKEFLNINSKEIATVLALGYPKEHFITTKRRQDIIEWVS